MNSLTLSLILSLFALSASFPQQPDSSQTIKFKCNYEQKIFGAREFYICRVVNFKNEDENLKIFEISGDHLIERESKNVESLIIEGNFKFLPKNVAEFFTNLVVFQASNSKLEKIAKENFYGLNLEILKLSKNKIKEIANDTFDQQQSLMKIHLDRNKIENLPENLFASTNRLEILNLELNKIKFLSENLLQNLPELRQLFLADNKIQKISIDTFKNNLNLEDLDLSNNNLQVIDSQILAGLKSLKNFDFTGNLCLKNLLDDGKVSKDELERMFEEHCRVGEIFYLYMESTLD